MIGAIIGDIIGSIYEWNNIKETEFPLFGDDCKFTDDSVQTIAVAEALLNGGSSDDFVDALKKYGKLYPKADYGGNMRKWLFSDDRNPYNSWGNGSAMRVSPCAWFADSLEEAELLAEKSAEVTHNHPEGIKGAEATVMAIFLAKQGQSINEIREYISKHYYPLDFTIDEIRPTYQFNETCQETVPQAIEAFLESNSFEDALKTGISLGGDSDTIGAITGAIAQAYYGIPDDIREQALAFLDDDMKSVLAEWEEFINTK